MTGAWQLSVTLQDSTVLLSYNLFMCVFTGDRSTQLWGKWRHIM